MQHSQACERVLLIQSVVAEMFLKTFRRKLPGVVKTFVTFLLAQITETHLRTAPDSQFRCNIRNCTTCPYIEHGNQSTFQSTGETTVLNLT